MSSYSATFSILMILGFAGCSASDAPAAQECPRPGLMYKVQHGWPILPDGHALGFVSAVDIDSHGHVFTFHGFRRWVVPFAKEPESEPLVLIWNGDDGRLMGSWGSDIFRMPHGLSIDGDDNVWVTDVARNQVLKFSHGGELLLTLGENDVEGRDNTHFAQPTDVEFGLDGTVYVSDGYVNCRIVNFTPDGQYQFEWGECGDAAGQFNTPHDLAVDDQGRVYVADRENDRVQVFDPGGQFIEQWQSGGRWRPHGLSTSATEEVIFVVDGGEQPSSMPDRSSVVVLDFSGCQVAEFGRFGNQDGQFMLGHDIATGSDGFIYVVDIIGRRLQRFSESNQ